MCVQWEEGAQGRGETKSKFITISNCILHGRISSPRLFSVYMDDQFDMLINSGFGRYIKADQLDSVKKICILFENVIFHE